MLGSNLPRDSRAQEALNNALNDGAGAVLIAAPARVFALFKSSCPCLKNPRPMRVAHPSSLLTKNPSLCESALKLNRFWNYISAAIVIDQ